LTDRGRVAVGRDRPSFQDRRAEFGEGDETLFERPPIRRSTELLDLLLQNRDALLEFVRLHLRPVRAWYTNPSNRSNTVSGTDCVERFFMSNTSFRR
jgi:hypothetical protein